MKPYLSRIARAYVDHEAENLIDFCFVFPNKRSGMMMSHYFDRALSQRRAAKGDVPMFLPAITTISDLVADLTDGVDAGRIQLLLIVYDVYRAVLKAAGQEGNIVPFDRFIYWGDVILNDFNDVDSYLVDPSELWRNVRDLKEISSNFLTPEQIAVINEYWGEIPGGQEDVEGFWKHFSRGGSHPAAESFMRLWQVMLDIYRGLNARLDELGLTYSGRSYRSAVETLKAIDTESLPYKRYVFVGFNVLSTAETRIFEILNDRKIADFYWDYASPAFKGHGGKSTRFLKHYVKHFRSRYDIDEPEITDFPAIHIEGIPSNVGQVKRAGEILDELQREGLICGEDSAESDLRTAVVLPDQQLFLPLLHSIPDSIPDVNITMGYQLRHTSIATLIGAIALMQSRSQILKGEPTFYYEHLLPVLSHPLIRSLAAEECDIITNHINSFKVFNLPARVAIDLAPALAPLLSPVKSCQNVGEVLDYVENLTNWMLRGFSDMDEAQQDSGETSTHKVQVSFIRSYQECVNTLRYYAGQYHITMNDTTVFHLLDRLMSSERVNFIGEPLKGVQIMGMLETRALDFDYLIIPSMNERIFPRSHYAPTFIPESLRRGYGMSTMEFQESVFAYYFYRLITRASRVYLLYDTRSSGGKSGEMSRYLYQLAYLHNIPSLTMINRSYTFTSSDNRMFAIPKTPEVMEKLNRYLSDERHPQHPERYRYALSASSIDKYIKCPVQFYLTTVEKFYVDDEMRDYMDEGTYGRVLHQVAERLYNSLRRPGGEGGWVDRAAIESLLSRPTMIEREITASINELYLNKGVGCYDELTGQNKLIAKAINRFIHLLLNADSANSPFTFLASEMPLNVKFEVESGLKFNLTGYIDRVDRLDNGTVRIVDYKTGADKLTIAGWDEVFDKNNPNHQKAFLQLMLYANAFARQQKWEGPVQPIIYKLNNLGSQGVTPLKFAKAPLLDYRDINQEFLPQFGTVIDEIFNPDIPFVSPVHNHSCKYCKFTSICDRKK